MRQSLILIILLLSIQLMSAQNKLSNEQKAWLYRITQLTPVLQRNWDTYFTFDKAPFTKTSFNGTLIEYDAIEYYQSYNPESLKIDWQKIASSSPGLIAETSTLLALYELNQILLEAIQEESSQDSIYNSLSQKLSKALPAKTKKQEQIIQTIIHPSLPLKIKTEKLGRKYKLNAQEQKVLLNAWRATLNTYLTQRSQNFFKQLSPEGHYYEMLLLAAGEGSGTAGLLYEQEKHPDGTDKRWYGKGIGLFTYEMRVRKESIVPKENTRSTIGQLNSSQPSLHLSLWGLNSSFKPLVVVTVDNKSYHLFSDFKSKELSPDPQHGLGVSFIDRIEQNRIKLIEKPLKELQGEGSLTSILEKENRSKEKIETKLSILETEIDSLQKLEPISENAINYRRNSINSLLNSLSDKTERIAKVERKLSDAYRNIERAEQKIASMNEQLGPNPQTWVMDKHQYVFSDGVVFDRNTQDLIFKNGINEDEIQIHLLSASYNLKGEQRDEVQLLVNSTSSPQPKTEIEITEAHFINDTITESGYFHPDAFTLNEISYPSYSLINTFPDTLNYQVHLKSKAIRLRADSPKSYKDLKREKEFPLSELGKHRFAQLECIRTKDEVLITITSSCDPVPTRLSQLPRELRKRLKITEASVSHNHYLSALRGLYMLHVYFGYQSVETIKLHYPLSEEEIKLLWEHVISIPPPVPAP
ncbi:coiled-coil domain-containing protein [Carboxylicivirga sp. N1Y90]|uniref:coiled-coil domain-containing protein n=1 Tax=Carboxylicivirga fragile TaxID=3417571 RepID=UPI003D33A0B4|nr:hypothetical protein [Marinilabiliaceae bacterium N1Y90]